MEIKLQKNGNLQTINWFAIVALQEKIGFFVCTILVECLSTKISAVGIFPSTARNGARQFCEFPDSAF